MLRWVRADEKKNLRSWRELYIEVICAAEILGGRNT